jgi:hypothetical protein
MKNVARMGLMSEGLLPQGAQLHQKPTTYKSLS